MIVRVASCADDRGGATEKALDTLLPGETLPQLTSVGHLMLQSGTGNRWILFSRFVDFLMLLLIANVITLLRNTPMNTHGILNVLKLFFGDDFQAGELFSLLSLKLKSPTGDMNAETSGWRNKWLVWGECTAAMARTGLLAS